MQKLEDRVSALTRNIIGDVEESRTIDEVKLYDHPDEETIKEIVESLRKIIFPGYFRNKSYRVYTLRNTMGMLIEDVVFKLISQISIVLRYDDKYSHLSQKDITGLAEEKTFDFMNSIPKIRSFIETDVQAAYDGDPAAYNKDEIIYSYPGLYAILINRIAHELFLLDVPLIPRIMTEFAHSKTGIDIHPGATIGKYFFIDHGTGIVIGETTVIGNNVKIYQGVTLGALSTRGGQSLKNKKRHPTIEDNVTIYSGASILGGDTVVEKGSVIGGNAFITKTVPEGAKVSIKNQELRYKYDVEPSLEKKEFDEEESWFYVI